LYPHSGRKAEVVPGPLGVIFDQVCGLCLPFDVRFAPKVTEAGTGPGSLCLAERL